MIMVAENYCGIPYSHHIVLGWWDFTEWCAAKSPGNNNSEIVSNTREDFLICRHIILSYSLVLRLLRFRSQAQETHDLASRQKRVEIVINLSGWAPFTWWRILINCSWIKLSSLYLFTCNTSHDHLLRQTGRQAPTTRADRGWWEEQKIHKRNNKIVLSHHVPMDTRLA